MRPWFWEDRRLLFSLHAMADPSRRHAFLKSLHLLVQDEQAATRRQLLATWERPLADKLLTGFSQGFRWLEKGAEPGTLWAYPDESESRFREGDLLCLHQGQPLAPLGRWLSFELEDDERWLLRGKSAEFILSGYDGGPCYADPDALDLGAYYEQALEDIASSSAGQEVILPLLCGELTPSFDEDDMAEALASALDEGLNSQQAEAVSWAHGAHHVACIQGPPGTGKTRVLGLIARLAMQRGERVLVTSHTHMAINNALGAIHAQGGAPVVKIGRATQRKGLDEDIENFESLGDWEQRPTDGYTVGATPFATCNGRLGDHTFDTIIFDEASQITPALALMAMRRGKRYIFIGDQKQLPPVLLSRSVLDKAQHAVFGRLTARQADHLVMLQETYRMNQWLTQWPSQTYYGGALRAAGPNAARRLAMPPASAASAAGMAAALAAVLDPNAPAVFIPSHQTQARAANPVQAQWIVRLCEALAKAGLPLHDVGVVTPYRAQGRIIRSRLRQRFGPALARQVVADTVERMQGQEREVVILSLASGDALFLQTVAAFFFQPERLNVSITRAKTKLIIMGPDRDHLPALENETMQIWAGQYASLLAHCRRVTLPEAD